MISELKKLMEKIELPFSKSTEQGKVFSTGIPVSFTYIHNTEKSPNLGSRFLQNLEPAGFYMLHQESPYPMKGWESGIIYFNNPLVIEFNTEDGVSYNENNWKFILSRFFKARGKKLADKIRRAGYDGIVTVANGETKEIVSLKI